MKKSILCILSILIIFSFNACSSEVKVQEKSALTSAESLNTDKSTSKSENKKTDKNGSETTSISTTKNTENDSKTSATKSKKSSENSTTKATKKSDENKQTKTTTKKSNITKATTTTEKVTENYCFVTVECKEILSNMDSLKAGHEKYVPKSGYIISNSKEAFRQGDTVYDVLKSACNKNGIKLTASSSAFGIYVSGINNLDEKDCTNESGWVYTVNGKSVPKSCSKYKVTNKDSIVFSYICG